MGKISDCAKKIEGKIKSLKDKIKSKYKYIVFVLIMYIAGFMTHAFLWSK